MGSDVKFSVLMSLYYKESPAYLQDCFLSLQAQTLPADEIVLVFDGPVGEDLEAVVLKWYEKLPIVLVRLESNVGLGRALNHGLAECSNDWVFRMDTDDICLPERFERQVARIMSNPSLSLIGTQVMEFDGSPNNVVGVKSVPCRHEDILKFASRRNPFNHMSVAYKRSVVAGVGGYKHHMYMEDYNLWLRLLASGVEAENLSENLLLVRAGSSMLQRRRGWIYVKSEYELLQLKNRLGVSSLVNNYGSFVLRSISRLLPAWLLARVYSFLRKNFV